MSATRAETDKAAGLREYIKASEELDARLHEAGIVLAQARPSELDYDQPAERRPLDWRWRRICELHRRQLPANHAKDDAWIRRGVAYKRRQRQSEDSPESGVREGFADIDDAVAIDCSFPGLQRAVVQARLLAGNSCAEVAAACNLPVAVVDAYQNLFFAVQHLRSNPTLLAPEVLPIDPAQQFAEGNAGPILKLIGLIHPDILDAAIRVLVHESKDDNDLRVVLPILVQLTRNTVISKAATYGLGPAKLHRGMYGMLFMVQKFIPHLAGQD
jgi:hypothetical protein